MSTVTATIPTVNTSSSPIQVEGLYTPTTFSGQDYIQGKPGFSLGLTFKFQGASVKFGIYTSQVDGFTLTVDGTPYVTTATANAWQVYTWSGFADDGTVHTARLKAKDDGGFYFIDRGTGSSVVSAPTITGTAPTITVASALYGQKYFPGANSFFQMADMTATGYMTMEGYPTVSAGNGNFLMSPIKGISFRSSTTFIKIQCQNTSTGGLYSVYQDGNPTPIADNIPTVSNTSNIVLLASGLSGTHEYLVVCHAGNGITQSMSCIEIDSGSLSATVHAPKPAELWQGDSIANGLGIADGSGRTVWRNIDCYIVSRALGNWPVISASSGANISTYLRDHVADFNPTNMPNLIVANVVRIWEEGGTNDCDGLIASATFQADYHTTLTNFQALFPGVQIIAKQILPTTRDSLSQLNTYRALQAAAVSGLSNVMVVSTTTWWDPTNGTLTADGLHPNAAGYAVLAPFQIALFGAAAIHFVPSLFSLTPLSGGQY